MPLSPGRYYPGSAIRLTASFRDENGTDIDPDTLKIKAWSPQGILSQYVYGTDANVVRASAGNYYAEVTPDAAGLWRIRWETTGTNATHATEDKFNVSYSPFYDDNVSDYA